MFHIWENESVQRGPMPPLLSGEPFDGDDWLFELKLDGFRALAHIDGDRCELVSRNGHPFLKWDVLKADLARSVRATAAVIDGEIVCLDAAGASDFYALMFSRKAPVFCAFDLLAADGHDLRGLPLVERKRRLRAVMPRGDSRLRYVDHVRRRGRDFFALACQHDLEGIVAKWKHGTYQTDGASTSWLKIKILHTVRPKVGRNSSNSIAGRALRHRRRGRVVF
jgi:bifunctional non-homologous end joining protein LigD